MKISGNLKANSDWNRCNFFKTGVFLACGSLIAAAIGAKKAMGVIEYQNQLKNYLPFVKH